MPCGSLAVSQALLTPDVAKELIGAPDLADALRGWLAQALGREVHLEVADEWVRNHSQSVKGEPYLSIHTTDFAVALTISTKNGIRLADYGNTGFAVDQVEAFCNALAQAAAQERIVAMLAERYRLTQDTPLPSGLRTLELEV